jgi:hypothetical protein
MCENINDSRSGMLEKMRQILSTHDEIVAAYLFGSYAKGHARSDSDIDVGLLLSDNVQFGVLYPVQVARELKDGCQIRQDIDVRILNKGTLRFLHQVLKGKLLFSRDDKKRIEFETSAIDRYLDFKPFLEEYDRMRKERLLQ